jgi:hypothetical protein
MASRASVCLLVASLFVASEAHADPTAADRETARSLMQQGRELRDKGDLKEALKSFKAADDVMHVPTTELELARVQVSLGQLVEARDTIAAMRQWPAKRSDPVPFNEARAKAEELDASLNGRVPALLITVKGTGPGEQATVAVDGVSLSAGVLGLPRSVDPGHHVVTAKTPTGEGKAEADVREGEQKPVEVTVVQTAPPESAETATPPPAETETPEPTTTRSHGPGTLTWAGIGLAGAGVIAGSVTGLLAMSKKSTLDAECANKICGPSSDSDLNSANLLATISDVAFAASGAGAVVAIVSLIVGHEQSTAPAAQPPAAGGLRVMPWLGLGSGGVRGTF